MKPETDPAQSWYPWIRAKSIHWSPGAAIYRQSLFFASSYSLQFVQALPDEFCLVEINRDILAQLYLWFSGHAFSFPA